MKFYCFINYASVHNVRISDCDSGTEENYMDDLLLKPKNTRNARKCKWDANKYHRVHA
jgi:hypothetical protein